MKISIICVGKIKEAFYRDAIDEYIKRLSKYHKMQILEAADEKTPDEAGEALKEQILAKEAERIHKLMKPDSYKIVLAINGKRMDSVAFAGMIEAVAVRGTSHIQFIIGGSLGLHSSVLERADASISFSDMTFPHQLMRVIVLEQIYRAARITSGEPYHK